ncbi:cuticle protein AM1199-like [Panulirus ornatus]|uniref:cuticle protein AM1199-like n=1 Tax=Panulirus ornatus TaxID=150431 RepID=UPI003A8C026F
MQLVVLACLAAVAVAAPQQFVGDFVEQKRPIAILSQNQQDNGDGSFTYDFEAENGIAVSAVGTPGSKGQSNIQGTYRFPLPDGTIAEVRYFADENGFRAESPLIPTAYPLPAFVAEQVAFAEEERRLQETVTQ